MAIVKSKNEIFVEALNSEKRVYTFSLRKKENEKNNFLLAISERPKDINSKEFVANKIRIYNESLDSFFEKIDRIKKIVYEERNKK